VAPMTLVGRTALSVLTSTKWETRRREATDARVNVPSTLARTLASRRP